MKFPTSDITLLSCVLVLAAIPCQAQSRPNIVLLFADDAGYADLGFTGSRFFKTPHLDKLATSGVRLTQFYVTAAVCGPSRAGLLTGQYQQKFGFEENNVPGYMSPSSRLDDEHMGLPLGPKTVADYLQALGYRTAIFGKWHQGNADELHPFRRGFDEFVGFRGGSRSYFAYPPNNTQAAWYDHIEHGFRDFREPDKYLTDFIADEACAFIARNRDRPFFAFVSFNAVHTPLEADPQDAALFPELDGKRRTLAQMTFSMDRAIGRILAQLDSLGLTNNTLIVFTNDNGGPTDVAASSNYPFSGTKATELEGGIRVPAIEVLGCGLFWV
jgi:arylsulfatase A-like enzyme